MMINAIFKVVRCRRKTRRHL